MESRGKKSGKPTQAWLLGFCQLCLAVLAGAQQPSSPKPAVWGFNLLATYPHDKGAFTEGLIYQQACADSGCNGTLWESTGSQFYQSTVRRTDLATGTILEEQLLPEQEWAEGLTLFNDTLYQLTWQNPVMWQYPGGNISAGSSTPVGLSQGWGLTTNGSVLIASDGSATLTFLDPATLAPLSTVQVSDGGRPVSDMNELEFIDGMVWANIWTTPCIAVIDPDSGIVTAWLQLTNFKSTLQSEYPNSQPQMDVVNGIAFSGNASVFVTGKDFPQVWEISMYEDVSADLDSTRSACFDVSS